MAGIFSAQQAAATFDPLAATYEQLYGYHRDDVGHFMDKANIQGNESVLDLGTGTGWVAKEARQHTSGKVVGIDISSKMVAEAQRQAKHQGLSIAYLTGDMITLEGLDGIKPPGGFDVILCLWAFSNVAPAQRVAALSRWKSFLAPQGRIVFDMHHPNNDLAGYDVRTESGKSVFRWKMLDQQSVTECMEAYKGVGEQAGLKLVGEVELIGVEGYVDHQSRVKTVLGAADIHNPSRAQLESGKQRLLQSLANFYWPSCGEIGRPVVQHKVVSVIGVWHSR